MNLRLRYLFLILLNLPLVARAQTGSASSGDTLDRLENIGEKVYGDKLPTHPAIIVGNLAAILLGFLGVIFTVLIIWSGFQWMTSGGNEQKVAQAKNRLTAAAIGLVIIMVAYIATYYINLYVFE